MSGTTGKRLAFFFTVIILAALWILIRYALLMLGGSPPQAARPRSLPERGAILDMNGRYLALQTRLANISVWRPEITDVEALSKELAPILEMPAAGIEEKITGAPADFIYLKKQVADTTIKLIHAARAEGKLRGVSVEPVMGRIYPEKSLASQIIGFVGDENDGLGGIEYAFDNELAGAGNNGKGSQVVLTIDANVQHILEQIAEATMQENQAEAVMLMRY